MKKLKEKKEKWNEGDTGRRIETNIFAYKHVHTYKHASHTCDFTHRFFTALTLLHNRFYAKHCYTQTLLHTDALTQTLLHRDSFTHKHFQRGRFYRQSLLHTSTCTRRPFTRTNQTRKKPSVFDTQTSFRAKGLPPDRPKSQKIISFWHSHLAWCETVAAEDVKLQ